MGDHLATIDMGQKMGGSASIVQDAVYSETRHHCDSVVNLIA